MDEGNIDNEKLFAIKLADNDKKIRDKCVKKITAYISARSSTKDGRFHLVMEKKPVISLYLILLCSKFKIYLVKRI